MGYGDKPILKPTAVPSICLSNEDVANVSNIGRNLERSNVSQKLSAFNLIEAYIEHCLV